MSETLLNHKKAKLLYEHERIIFDDIRVDKNKIWQKSRDVIALTNYMD